HVPRALRVVHAHRLGAAAGVSAVAGGAGAALLVDDAAAPDAHEEEAGLAHRAVGVAEAGGAAAARGLADVAAGAQRLIAGVHRADAARVDVAVRAAVLAGRVGDA